MGMYILYLALLVLSLVGPITLTPLIDIKDLWITKEFLCLLSIGLIYLLSKQSFHRAIPWPIKSLCVFLIISAYLAPPIHLLLGNLDLGGAWIWKSLLWCFVYLALYKAITSSIINKDLISKAIGYSALVSSVYAIVQFMNIDQFQTLRDFHEIGLFNTHPEMTAMVGNSVFLSVWLLICLPFCLYTLKWWQTGIVVVTILLAGSDTAIAGLILMALIMALYRVKNRFVWLSIPILAIGVIVSIWASWGQIKPIVDKHANGRLEIWSDTIRDWHSPAIVMPVTEDMPESRKKDVEILNKRTWSLTGRGLGSFEFMFQKNHPKWNDPHNVYLRTLYETGLVGLCLFMAMIGILIYQILSSGITLTDGWAKTIFISFILILFAGLTTPLLIIEPIRFYCVVVFSLLSSLGTQPRP